MEVLEKLANNQEGPISAKSIYAPIAVSGGGTYVIFPTEAIRIVWGQAQEANCGLVIA